MSNLLAHKYTMRQLYSFQFALSNEWNPMENIHSTIYVYLGNTPMKPSVIQGILALYSMPALHPSSNRKIWMVFKPLGKSKKIIIIEVCPYTLGKKPSMEQKYNKLLANQCWRSYFGDVMTILSQVLIVSRSLGTVVLYFRFTREWFMSGRTSGTGQLLTLNTLTFAQSISKC